MTAVQDSVSRLVNVKVMDIFKESSGNNSSCVCGDKNTYLNQNMLIP